MKVYRTLLFIPGNKPKWMENIDKYPVDAVILDLEDSVPAEEKQRARNHISTVLAKVPDQTKVDVFVRINKVNGKFSIDDIEAVMQPNLAGIVIPKVELPREINQLSHTISELEKKHGLQIGSTAILPILETAKAIYFSYDIACCERVIGITGLSSKNGDVERALGTQWTFAGLETLYMKSKIVLAARAAEVTPIGGLWQDVHNLEGLRTSAKKNRQLGFDGELILHPSNAEIVNKAYSPSKEDIAYYKGLIETFNTAKKRGDASIIYEGSHIDLAHVETAKEFLAFAKEINC